ncbi:hypothetical protein QFZ81_001679 [Paenibacillus sp. V4I9]|uniref:metallophosphoesterase family protein n=1 Tax=Paenibacillus sp. V4I9 TaxID=3042308 RepID=UPI002787B1A7|nr:metallophosphoesterase [Paenibacillus sp. V4I9]MDQ0886591.1 hypothetical protein [Paenibacillus sp. V4I9]
MVLNTNNRDGASHVQFMKETVAAVPNTKWKFVTFHHDIYGAGPHSTEAAITGLRAALFPTFDELDVDMIFMGHDHSYVRTYVMKGDIPQKNQLIDSQGQVVNPTGATYLTANSASGSKYYELMTTPEVYSEVRSQLKVPTFSTINVTPSSIKINTYRTDTMAVVDTYSMVKDHIAPTYTLTANGAPFVEGTGYQANQSVSFQLTTQDQQTSVVSESMTLDGNPYTNGSPVDLADKLGVHTLTIVAIDYAGNKLDMSMNFKVETSLPSLKSLLDRYIAKGDLNGPLVNQLTNDLSQADHHLSKGSKDQAAKFMQDFLKHLNNAPMASKVTTEVKDILTVDAQALIIAWSGQ